jgi:hypothetical protein
VETTNNSRERKNREFGLTLAALACLLLVLLRLAAGQTAGTQSTVPGESVRVNRPLLATDDCCFLDDVRCGLGEAS